MPNWTSCDLTVTGPAVELGRFLAVVKEPGEDDEPLLFERLLPMPAEYRHTVSGSNTYAAGDGLTWYEWQNRNWGVKWGDCHTSLGVVSENALDAANKWLDPRHFGIPDVEGDGTAGFVFDTPWGAPTDGIAEISRRWPRLRFHMEWTYEEDSEDEPASFGDWLEGVEVDP